jgi:acetyltransferase-like isoleucine patch superfamily enzyme
LHSEGAVPDRLLCYGATGTGTHIAHNVLHQGDGAAQLVAYIDDISGPGTNAYDGLPVIAVDGLPEYAGAGVLVSVHDIAARRRIFAHLHELGVPIVGSRSAPHIAHPSAVLGEGVLMTSESMLGPGTTIGRGTLALSSLIAHDVVVGEFCTLAMNSVVLGHVRIGDGVWIGAGAVIQNGTASRPRVIGDGAVIGAGAVVDRDVRPGEVLVGPRAMTLREWARLRLLSARRRS